MQCACVYTSSLPSFFRFESEVDAAGGFGESSGDDDDDDVVVDDDDVDVLGCDGDSNDIYKM